MTQKVSKLSTQYKSMVILSWEGYKVEIPRPTPKLGLILYIFYSPGRQACNNRDILIGKLHMIVQKSHNFKTKNKQTNQNPKGRDWTRWQLKYSVSKCEITFIERNNLSYSYTEMVCKITQEKDLGVTVDSLMETSTQCAVVVKKPKCQAILKMDQRIILEIITRLSNTSIKCSSF